MGAKQSAQPGDRFTASQPGHLQSASDARAGGDALHPNGALVDPGGARARARSMGSVPDGQNSIGLDGSLGIPAVTSPSAAPHLALSLSSPSASYPDSSDPLSREGGAMGPINHDLVEHFPTTNGRVFHAQSLPVHLSLPGIKCPVCSKFVLPDEIECHLIMCLTRPRVSYNEDVLSTSAGECVICFEDMESGDSIARLPCLCIYHKSCIDEWFEVNRSCPEHPND